MLRALAAGSDRFTEEEVGSLSVEPDLDELVARMAAESGEGS